MTSEQRAYGGDYVRCGFCDTLRRRDGVGCVTGEWFCLGWEACHELIDAKVRRRLINKTLVSDGKASGSARLNAKGVIR